MKEKKKMNIYPFRPVTNDNIELFDSERLDIHDYLYKKGLETKEKLKNLTLSEK